MKVSKLVIGIIMIVLSVFIVFQSGAAGLGNAMSGNGEVSGSAGVMLAVMFLASGIVYIATRKRDGLGGDIACLIMLVIAALMGWTNAGSYSDLMIWSWLGFIIGVGFFVWHFVVNKKGQKQNGAK